jgi:hypothetical protein
VPLWTDDFTSLYQILYERPAGPTASTPGLAFPGAPAPAPAPSK